MPISTDDVPIALEGTYQKPFCRFQITRNHRIGIGFGEKVFHHWKGLRDDFYAEWELGSFYGNWQLVSGGAVIADGSRREIDHIQLEKIVQPSLSTVKRIFHPDPFRVRVEFENSVWIDFLPIPEAADAIFHLFYPTKMYVSYLPSRGWKTEPSIK